MAFTPSKSLSVSSDPFEYYQMTDGEASTLGEALVQTNGRLTKCGATATPEFIAVAAVGAATPGGFIPVQRTKEEREFETTSSAQVAATLVGQKVTLNTDGLTVTATTTSGVFEISSTDAATPNSKVRGYFRR